MNSIDFIYMRIFSIEISKQSKFAILASSETGPNRPNSTETSEKQHFINMLPVQLFHDVQMASTGCDHSRSTHSSTAALWFWSPRIYRTRKLLVLKYPPRPLNYEINIKNYQYLMDP